MKIEVKDSFRKLCIFVPAARGPHCFSQWALSSILLRITYHLATCFTLSLIPGTPQPSIFYSPLFWEKIFFNKTSASPADWRVAHSNISFYSCRQRQKTNRLLAIPVRCLLPSVTFSSLSLEPRDRKPLPVAADNWVGTVFLMMP